MLPTHLYSYYFYIRYSRHLISCLCVFGCVYLLVVVLLLHCFFFRLLHIDYVLLCFSLKIICRVNIVFLILLAI